MFRYFSIRKSIGLMLVVLFLFISVSVTAYLVYNKYLSSKQNLIDNTIWQARSGVQQQVAIYYRDTDVLQALLGELLLNPVIQYAAVYDRLGKPISIRHQAKNSHTSTSGLPQVKPDLSALDVTQTIHDNPSGDGKILEISVPVYSFVNPHNTNISRKIFGQTLVLAHNQGSQNVMGYYVFAINLQQLQHSLLGYATKVGGICFVLFLVSIYLAQIITRRITVPLASLAQLADDISDGKLDQTFHAKGTGEAGQIAAMLNLVLSDLSSHKAKMDVESHFLNMKVNERTEQLSKRNKELNQAVKQVTQAKDRMRQLAYYDSLTSLPNRQLFTEQLELLLKISKRDKSILALLFLDLDNFKRINDSLGHTAGDMLLCEVGARLSNCIRESDLISQYFDPESKIDVSRLGGDEFTVVLYKLEEPKVAGVVAQRLLESLQTPMLIDGHEIVITPSIGIAIAPQDADTVEDLLKRADTAMYHAKTTGKNNYSFYSSAMKGTSVGRLKLESDLRRAVER